MQQIEQQHTQYSNSTTTQIYRSIALMHWSSLMRHSLCPIQCHLDQANSVRNKCQKWAFKWGFQPDLRIQHRTHVQVSEIQLGYVKGLLGSTCQMQGFYSIVVVNALQLMTIHNFTPVYFLFWGGGVKAKRKQKTTGQTSPR